MFSCEIYKIYKNIYFEEHLRKIASRLSGRDDVTSGKVNFRPEIRENFKKKKKKSVYQEFVWLLTHYNPVVLIYTPFSGSINKQHRVVIG